MFLPAQANSAVNVSTAATGATVPSGGAVQMAMNEQGFNLAAYCKALEKLSATTDYVFPAASTTASAAAAAAAAASLLGSALSANTVLPWAAPPQPNATSTNQNASVAPLDLSSATTKSAAKAPEAPLATTPLRIAARRTTDATSPAPIESELSVCAPLPREAFRKFDPAKLKERLAALPVGTSSSSSAGGASGAIEAHSDVKDSDNNEGDSSSIASVEPRPARERRVRRSAPALPDALESSGDNEDGPSGAKSRRMPQMIPADKKNEEYWDRRRRNNEAARRSRRVRRNKEDSLAHYAAHLEQVNAELRAQVADLQAELERSRAAKP